MSIARVYSNIVVDFLQRTLRIALVFVIIVDIAGFLFFIFPEVFSGISRDNLMMGMLGVFNLLNLFFVWVVYRVLRIFDYGR